MTSGPHHNAPPPGDPPDQTLAVWEYAGLMLTYWCSARCAFCYVSAGPRHTDWMDVRSAIGLWRSLDELADAYGKRMRIHIAGGEPFGHWVRLAAILRAARDAGLSPPEKVETNAAWATSAGVVRSRLELLDALGVERLIVSSDIFHQEFVPIEHVRRCVDGARRVFGKGRLIVRWWDFFNDPADAAALTALEKKRAFRAALAQHPDRLTGRAALRLGPLLPGRPPEAFRGLRCVDEVLHSRHVHIDPYGHVFPGTCGGIILGRATTGVDLQQRSPACPTPRTVADVWHDLRGNWPEHPVLAAVVAGGSYALYERIRQLGYEPLKRGYASKCHLCAHARQYVARRGLWPEHVGPPACYGYPTPTCAAGT